MDNNVPETLELNAVDERRTRIREDAFRISSFPQGDSHVGIQLYVACVIPPDHLSLDPRVLLENAIQKRGVERKPVFLLGNRAPYGLQSDSSRSVLYTKHTLSTTGELVESVGITEAIIDSHEYDSVSGSRWFTQSEELLQYFFAQEESVHKRYQSAHYQVRHGDTQAVREKAVVSAVLELFNIVVSEYASMHEIPTISYHNGNLAFNVNKRARFSAPLRNAIGFINLTNVVHHLRGESLPYHKEKLEDLGFRFINN